MIEETRMTPSRPPNLRAPGGSVVAARMAALAVAVAVAACSGAAVSPTAVTATGTPAAAATLGTQPSVAASVAASPSAVPLITSMPSAPDSGVTRDLVAKSGLFAPTALSAPAGQVWHVKFDQQDHKGTELIKHNFTIASIVTTRASELTVEQRMFQSDSYAVGTHTIDVPGLPAGTYTFFCTIHPAGMIGTLTIE
jgi:plastocyanin